jgi:hypothetical protein
LGPPGDAKPEEACGRGIGAVRIVAATRIGVLINVFVLDGVGPMQLIPCLRGCLELRGGVLTACVDDDWDDGEVFAAIVLVTDGYPPSSLAPGAAACRARSLNALCVRLLDS